MRLGSAAIAIASLCAANWCPMAAQAREFAVLTRVDAGRVELKREDAAPVTVWVSTDQALDSGDREVARGSRATTLTLDLPAAEPGYVLMREGGGPVRVVGERLLPLERGSNFRDLGGYVTKDGRTVRWGRVFRSGAQPLLSPRDEELVDKLGIGTVVDLRSNEERQINPDTIDDRTGALFISNDYAMASLMAGFRARGGEHIYQGMERSLAPQYRSFYRRIIASARDGEGAVLFHCSAGQDRTGVAAALLYDVLGIDRATILADYHRSTEWRRPHWEMPRIDPADFPGNSFAVYAASTPQDEHARAEPLYTRSGASHLAQFFSYVDGTYGGAEGYMRQVLGFGDADLAALRASMLD